MSVPCDGSWQEKNQPRQFARYVAPSTQDAPRISKICKSVQKNRTVTPLMKQLLTMKMTLRKLILFDHPLMLFPKASCLNRL